MKTLICETPGSLSYVESSKPDPVEGWVPVDIHTVGVCGTDYHLLSGKQPFVTYPRVMGHELSGTIAANSDSTLFKPGTKVVVNPYLACGDCTACSLGKSNCCENIEVLGVHRDGGMCETLLVPESNLIDAGGLSFGQAAMVEFLSVGRHAVSRTPCRKGASALVVGCGPIGLAAALYARIEGCEVKIADVSEERLKKVSKEFGLDTILISPDTDILAEHAPVDHLFDATGNINAMNNGLKYIAHGGTYTLLSVVQGDLVFADPELHKREVTLYASRNATPTDFEFVIESIRSGAIDANKMMTHRTTLAEAKEKIPEWAADRGSVIKAYIEINS